MFTLVNKIDDNNRLGVFFYYDDAVEFMVDSDLDPTEWEPVTIIEGPAWVTPAPFLLDGHPSNKATRTWLVGYANAAYPAWDIDCPVHGTHSIEPFNN